jgi:diguanylate cyclase (GGDEF)-like protein
VLQGAAYEMRGSLRDFELIYRLGGEEFLVLLPGAGLQDAAGVAERMRSAVAARPGGVRVSASFGVSAAEGEQIDLDRMLEAADTALRAAKRGGRDRVVTDSTGLRKLRPHEPVPHAVGQKLALAHDQTG